MKLWCCCGCVKLGLGTEHCVTARDTHWGNKGKNPMFLPPSLLINAVLFRLHQYLPCNKASQYVDVLFRAQLLSRKQFPNNRGRDEWPARAEAACSGRVCTAVSLPCPELALWAGSQLVTCSVPLLLPMCSCTFCLFFHGMHI